MGSLSSCHLGTDNIQALEFSVLAAFVFSTKKYHRRWRQHRAITVDTVDIVDTIDTVETVDTVDTVDTVRHCSTLLT